jgi:hypothetical protein
MYLCKCTSTALFTLPPQVWPRIRAAVQRRYPPIDPLPELHVFGAYPTPEISAWDDPATGFRIMGPVVNHLKKLSQYRVHVAPLRFGAGVKGKITDSWLAGLPVVTTPIGAEGMYAEATRNTRGISVEQPVSPLETHTAGFVCPFCHLSPGGQATNQIAFGGCVAHDADALAAHAVELYTDPDAWNKAVEIGQTTLIRAFSHDAVAPPLWQHLSSMFANRDAVRRTDAMGSVFWGPDCQSPAAFSMYLQKKKAGVL